MSYFRVFFWGRASRLQPHPPPPLNHCRRRGYVGIELSTAVGICDPSPEVEMATKNTSLATGGSVVLYQCDVGHRFSDATNATITCDGQNWSPIESSCQGNPHTEPTRYHADPPAVGIRTASHRADPYRMRLKRRRPHLTNGTNNETDRQTDRSMPASF